MPKKSFKNKYLRNSIGSQKKRSLQWITRLALALALAAHNLAQADFTFAAFGDTPYTDEDEARFISLIAEINREAPAFTLHVGDFKSGWSPCSDALFALRREQFALFHQPLIYVPGDNEWSDCWRAPGAARDPLERLQKLRSLFFAGRHSLGQQRIALTRQSAAYPEHARWVHQGILFATLNVPGGGNNRRMPRERAAREKALLEWLAGTFARARTQAHRALVLAMQANPFVHGAGRTSDYEALLHALAREAQTFAGEVLLIHGDTHRYRLDQPLMRPGTAQPVANVTRLEVFGYPSVNWVRVRVTRRNGKVAFEATPGM